MLQTYGAQVSVTGVGQLPVPTHVVMSDAMPSLQLGGAHVTLEPGGVPHALRMEPLHWALQSPVPLHAERAPWGAPETALHVPSAPPTSHASHWPVQAVSQQRPSTQRPDAHRVPLVHAVPLGSLHVPGSSGLLHLLGAPQVELVQHVPSMQVSPVAQGAVVLHGEPLVPLGTHFDDGASHL